MKRAMLPPTAASRLHAAVDAEHPDRALRKIAFFARCALGVSYELAGVVDDARVLVDGLGGEDAEAVRAGSPADDPWKADRLWHREDCRL